MLRFLVFAIHGLLLATAAVTMGKRAPTPKPGKAVGKNRPKITMPAMTTPAVVTPNGTGIPANRFADVDWKTMNTPPVFLSQLRMPVIPAAVLQAKPMPLPINTLVMQQAPVGPGGGQNSESDIVLKNEIKSQMGGALKSILEKKKNKQVFKTEDELVNGIVAAFKVAVNPELDQELRQSRARPGGRRLLGWFDDLIEAIEDVFVEVGCAAFATTSLPAYLAAYAWFEGLNGGYETLSTHQKYFQRSIFGEDILSQVSVKYNANMPPFFGSAQGVTMGKHIFIRGPPHRLDTANTWVMDLDVAFRSQTRLLNHEMGHVLQYKARNFAIAKFGWDYLKGFCEAGMSYADNAMEKNAETYRAQADALMWGQPVAHFKRWRAGNLYLMTGYPMIKAEKAGGFNVDGKAVMVLDMGKGVNKVGESQRKAGTFCVRAIWGPTHLAIRTQAEISGRPWTCMDVKPTAKPTGRPTTRKPTARPTPYTVSLGDGPIFQLTPTPRPTPIIVGPVGGTIPQLRPTPRPLS